MKAKSTLVIACLALVFLMTVGTTAAQAQSCCCYGEWIVGAPFYVAAGALMLTGAIVTAPVSYLGCGTCGFCLLRNFPCCLFPKCDQP
jgi:hypothetical protein